MRFLVLAEKAWRILNPSVLLPDSLFLWLFILSLLIEPAFTEFLSCAEC